MKDLNYPAMKWHPETGESRVFIAPEDVPAGWIDTHPNNLPPDVKPVAEALAAKIEGDALPLTKKQIKVELDAAGVTYPATANVKALYELLSDTLKTFCANNDIAYEPNADVPTLLALVKQPE